MITCSLHAHKNDIYSPVSDIWVKHTPGKLLKNVWWKDFRTSMCEFIKQGSSRFCYWQKLINKKNYKLTCPKFGYFVVFFGIWILPSHTGSISIGESQWDSESIDDSLYKDAGGPGPLIALKLRHRDVITNIPNDVMMMSKWR